MEISILQPSTLIYLFSFFVSAARCSEGSRSGNILGPTSIWAPLDAQIDALLTVASLLKELIGGERL